MPVLGSPSLALSRLPSPRAQSSLPVSGPEACRPLPRWYGPIPRIERNIGKWLRERDQGQDQDQSGGGFVAEGVPVPVPVPAGREMGQGEGSRRESQMPLHSQSSRGRQSSRGGTGPRGSVPEGAPGAHQPPDGGDVVGAIMRRAFWEDVDGVLNAWPGRKDRANFPPLLREVVRQGDLKMALCVFAWMRNQRCYRARPEYYSLLMTLAARHRKLSRVRQLYREMLERRCKPDVHAFVALILAHGKVGEWESAVGAFDEMVRSKVPPAREAYNALIHACGSAGQWQQAFAVMGRMERDGVRPDLVTFNSLLTALKSAQQHEAALRLFQRLGHEPPFQHLHADRVTLNLVMSCHAKLGQVEEVLHLLKRMEDGAIPGRGLLCRPNVVSHNIAIHALARAGRVHEARTAFERLLRSGLAPNRATFNSLIDAFAAQGRHTEAQDTFDALVDSGFEPDVVSYTSLLCAYGRACLPDRALEVVDLMRRRGCRPNAITYGALIDALGRGGRLQEAMAMKEEMEGVEGGRGVSKYAATTVTYCSLISACARLGQPTQAQMLVAEAHSRGVPLNTSVYNALLSAHACAPLHSPFGGAESSGSNSSDSEAVQAVLQDMQERGVPWDAVTYGVLMDLACKRGNVEWAHSLLLEMRRRGSHSHSPSQEGAGGEWGGQGARVPLEGATSIIHAYGQQGRWEDAERVLDDLRAHGPRPNAVTITAAMQAAAASGSGAVAEALFLELLQSAGADAGGGPDAAAVVVLLQAYNSCLQFAKATRVGVLLLDAWDAQLGVQTSVEPEPEANAEVETDAEAEREANGRAEGEHEREAESETELGAGSGKQMDADALRVPGVHASLGEPATCQGEGHGALQPTASSSVAAFCNTRGSARHGRGQSLSHEGKGVAHASFFQGRYDTVRDAVAQHQEQQALGDSGFAAVLDAVRDAAAQGAVPLSRAVCNEVVTACCSSGSWKMAMRLLHTAAAAASAFRSAPSSPSPVGAAALALKHGRQLLQEQPLVREEEGEGGVGNSSWERTEAHGGALVTTPVKDKGGGIGLSPFRIDDGGFAPLSRMGEGSSSSGLLSARSFLLILETLSRARRPEECVEVYRRHMPLWGVSPRDRMYHLIVSACAWANQWEMCLEILRDMRAAGLCPSHKSYNLTLSALIASGQWPLALQLFARMEDEGLHLNSGVLARLAALLRSEGQNEKASELLRRNALTVANS